MIHDAVWVGQKKQAAPLESLPLHAAWFLLEGCSTRFRVLLVLRWAIGAVCGKVESQDDAEASVDIHRKRHFRICRVLLEVQC